MNATLLEMKAMKKRFKATVALDDVNLEVKTGEVHMLLGENGAGKSTLMKILAGSVQPDEGQIYWEEKPVTIMSPADSLSLGIGMVYQELTLVKQMNVIENIHLGRLPKRKNMGLVNWNKVRHDTQDILKKLELSSLDLNKPVNQFDLGTQQLVEIARAISRESKLIILDEPTSALREDEAEKLFTVIRDLKKQGIAFIYITHKLKEVFAIGDRVTVLRDGKTIGTEKVKNLDEATLIKMMVGRSLEEQYPKEDHVTDEVILQVDSISDDSTIKRCSFRLHKGEILGIAGLEGSGRTDLVELLFGFGKVKDSQITLFGETYTPRTPHYAISRKIAYLTKDRKKSLLLHMPVYQNITVSSPKKYSSFGFRHRKEELTTAKEYLQKLKVNTNDPQKKVSELSGGNQQKVAIARWLCSQSKIFIMDEPTRGIDIGAKVEVYKLMNQIVKEGGGIILISSEMPELLGMSDRILVMREGNIVGDFHIQENTQELIMQRATGGVNVDGAYQ